jgi:hypothetical protein
MPHARGPRKSPEKAQPAFARPSQPEPGTDSLFPRQQMCYNRPAVERAPKQVSVPTGQIRGVSARDAGAPEGESSVVGLGEHVSRYCPVCSQRLESRQCKLICPVCGYYMSCADYY